MIFYNLSEVLDKPLFNAEFGDQEHDFDVELRGFALYRSASSTVFVPEKIYLGNLATRELSLSGIIYAKTS